VGRRAVLILAALAPILLLPAAAGAQEDESHYRLAGGCYAIRDATPAGPFRMQATTLGRYLFYGPERTYLAGSDQGVAMAEGASPAADWRVEPAADGAFDVTLPSAGKALARGADGALALADAPTPLRLDAAQGCPEYPEVDVSVTGDPMKIETPWGETRGTIDLHMHHMAFEFLGGKAHCGRPWHPYGAPYALVDCPDHEPNGAGAVLENTVSYGNPVGTHDTVGWPTFKDWPHHNSLTHEQSYYKWLERVWRSGLRVFVNLLVDNAALCKLYPLKADRPNVCNEMATVRLQARQMRELERYIDAQSGGPGKGWYRIVTDPFEARRVIAEGKLAVIMGIEVSQLFDCNLRNDVPQCSREDVDRELAAAWDMGVRQMEIINKFDNAFGGVAGDSDVQGPIVNGGNFIETGKFWQLQTCTGEEHDHEQITTHNQDQVVINGLQAFMPPGAVPIYPKPPHCNVKGLSDLGEHLVRRMISRGMIIDPDHLSVLARKQLLALVEAQDYSGIVSSHSWSTADAYPRIYRLGGVVTPYAGSSTSFAETWKERRSERDPRFYWGFGYGADMNGFGHQGGPRASAKDNPVRYPFRSPIDPGVTVHQQRSGERVYDINPEGVAHYGLYADWMEDLRKIVGDQITEDLARGSEAYLQMWERAAGVPASTCRGAHLDVSRRGIGGVRIGARNEPLLRRASQPRTRGPRAWTWCVRGRGNRRARTTSVLTTAGRVGLVASTARTHRARRVGAGARASRLRGVRRFGPGVRVRNVRGGGKLVYGIRRGRVRYAAVASRGVARSRARLRSYLRLAGLSR
jgi:hypothetical protein